MKKTLFEYFKDSNILVADDMPNMRKTIRNMLKSMKLEDKQIIEANDGDIALKIVQDGMQNITFILLDWNMPRLTGIEVLKKIKRDEKTKDIPVLIISAEMDMVRILRAVECGVDNYVIKPFLPNTLQQKMLNIINPPDYEIVIKEGEELIRQGYFDKALDVLQEVLKILPDSAGVRILMGKACEEKGENEKALQLYKESVEKNSLFLNAHNSLTDFLLRTGDKKAALLSMERTAEISPANENRYIMIGELALEAEKDPTKARKAFKAAMKQMPQRAEEVAEIYLKHEYAVQAEEFFRNSLTQNENVHVYNRLGVALRKQNKWKEAIEEYRKALQVEPENETVFFNIGTAYLEGDKIEGNKKKDALQSFNKALDINPDFAEAKEALKNI